MLESTEKNIFFKLFSIYTSILILFFSLFEFLLIELNFNEKNNFIPQFLGLIRDFSIALILLFFFNAFLSLFNKKTKTIILFFAFFFLTVISIIHFFILRYFLYQLEHLGLFIWKQKSFETIFSIQSSGYDLIHEISKTLLLFFAFISVAFLIARLNIFISITKRLLLLSIIYLISIQFFDVSQNKFYQNETLHFSQQSLSYFFRGNVVDEKLSKAELAVFRNFFGDDQFVSDEFPLFRSSTNNELDYSSFFEKTDSSMNVVLIIVEGLNNDFISGYKGHIWMPFLSEMKNKSLYFDHCFSTSERSFNALPSTVGSVPYGPNPHCENGIFPKHFSIVNVLRANNYECSFFDGQGSWFHNKSEYLNYSQINRVIDNSVFPSKYKKIIVKDFFWGYNDKDLFTNYFDIVDSIKNRQRLDLFFTGTMHSPFIITNQKYYEKKLEQQYVQNEFIKKYKKYLMTLMFTDDALRDFFNRYSKRKEFQNTIFIITGDHPMTELPIENDLKRYHVPLIIFSEKLNRSKCFSKYTSHLAIQRILFQILKKQGVRIPDKTSDLVVKNRFRHLFMNRDREPIDYLSDNYFISKDQLYRVGKKLKLIPINNMRIFNQLSIERLLFSKFYSTMNLNNIIIPDNYFHRFFGHNIVLSKIKSFKSENSNEFINFNLSLPLTKGSYKLDLLIEKTEGMKTKELKLVNSIVNKDGKLIKWESQGLGDNKMFSQHQSKIDIDKSGFIFSCYLFNPEKIIVAPFKLKYSLIKL
jgi:phosphoglycerol transferase MdoB-like AlkP superfamily enzyme